LNRALWRRRGLLLRLWLELWYVKEFHAMENDTIKGFKHLDNTSFERKI